MLFYNGKREGWGFCPDPRSRRKFDDRIYKASQLFYVCLEGPVFNYSRAKELLD